MMRVSSTFEPGERAVPLLTYFLENEDLTHSGVMGRRQESKSALETKKRIVTGYGIYLPRSSAAMCSKCLAKRKFLQSEM